MHISDPGVHFTCGLSDINAVMGQSAELVCKLSSENCDGVWYKDGEEVSHSKPLDMFTYLTKLIKYIKGGTVARAVAVPVAGVQ